VHDLLVEHVSRRQQEEQEDQREEDLRQHRRRLQRDGDGAARLLHHDPLHVRVLGRLAVGDLVDLRVDLLGGLAHALGGAAQVAELPLDLPADVRRVGDPFARRHRQAEHHRSHPCEERAHDQQRRCPRRHPGALHRAAERAEHERQQQRQHHRHQERPRIGDGVDHEQQEETDDRPARRDRQAQRGRDRARVGPGLTLIGHRSPHPSRGSATPAQRANPPAAAPAQVTAARAR
jgi:hypothetical protein